MRRPPRISLHIRALSAGVLLSACRSPANADDISWTRQAITTLGANDGYLFVFSPFNCGLRQEQIDALNALSRRSRRSGRILTIGYELPDSALARRATTELGITLASLPFATTALGRSPEGRALGVPLAVAIRDGHVIATLSGGDAERIDEWIAWLENR